MRRRTGYRPIMDRPECAALPHRGHAGGCAQAGIERTHTLFFGYIFLIIIIGFSLVGILKTFENDLITNFPEIEYIYEILNQQLIYISETVKNLITIFKDLINSY